jgi:hypothetical protein
VPLAPPAAAQGYGAGRDASGNMTAPVVPGAENKKSRLPAPAALPGAQSNGDAAPMDRPPSDLKPNDALFDAINRGDIGSARDALSRGADLRATNVLGLTPTELSVDLGRNDITFLLLSMRGSSRGGRAPVADAGKPAPPRTAKAEPPRPPARPAPQRTPAVAAAPARATPASVQQYADMPAAPVPQAGFLGFGGAQR